VFFALPVLWYELDFLKAFSWPVRIKKIFFAGFGSGLAFLFFFWESPWSGLSQNGYMHFKIADWTQWRDHFRLLVRVWPSYWLGEIPWSYLQNSRLGKILTPVSWTGGGNFLSFIFWALLAATSWGLLKTLAKKNSRKETVLWIVPPALFLLFFIFGSQTWDAL